MNRFVWGVTLVGILSSCSAKHPPTTEPSKPIIEITTCKPEINLTMYMSKVEGDAISEAYFKGNTDIVYDITKSTVDTFADMGIKVNVRHKPYEGPDRMGSHKLITPYSHDVEVLYGTVDESLIANYGDVKKGLEKIASNNNCTIDGDIQTSIEEDEESHTCTIEEARDKIENSWLGYCTGVGDITLFAKDKKIFVVGDVLTHEVGHSLGLDHTPMSNMVNGKKNVMYKQIGDTNNYGFIGSDQYAIKLQFCPLDIPPEC